MYQSLKEFFGLEKIDFRVVQPQEFAHCIIDVQREFCDPGYSCRASEETARISGHIADVADSFRKAGIPTFLVYFSEDFSEGAYKNACGGFYKIEPREGDILVPKDDESAFFGSNISKLLKERNLKTLLISGFNIRACVHATVEDALKEKYGVWLLEDCIGDDAWGRKSKVPGHIESMKKAGARCKSAAAALQEIQARRPKSP